MTNLSSTYIVLSDTRMIMRRLIPLLLALLPIAPFAQEKEADCAELCFDQDPYIDPKKRWYFEVKPGYCFFTDSEMNHFFDNGGFTFRAESGCNFYGPFIVWVDGGYFQKEGHALGGTEKIDFKLASITLGLKAIYYFHERAAIYVGAGPRLFLLMMHNHSPFVRGDDNAVGIGGGFDGGFWIFPLPHFPNIFLDLFADYSWKTMKVDADEISSIDSNVNVSSFSAGLGLGLRF